MATRASMFQESGRSMRRIAALGIAVAIVAMLTSCSFVLGLFDDDDLDTTQLVRDKMAHIVDAVNNQDAATLRAMFTDYALAEYSTDIDEGVARLLSMFPDGDVIWRDDAGLAGESGQREYGKRSTLSGASYVVTSGGKEYTLSFSLYTENTIDPDNVGVYQMGAVPHTESGDSGLEMAFHAWPQTEGTWWFAGGPPGLFLGDSGGLTRDRAAHIIDALNAHDAAALKGMFTEYARSEHSTDIDEGLDYLFSLFPDGDITWQESQGGSSVYQRVDGEKKTVLLPTFYTVSSGGVDYRLFFADFIENTIDPDNVGIYAVGVVPAAECLSCVPEAELYAWASWFDPDATGHPGVFIPPEHSADVRMQQIAAALESRDASALKNMFSPYAREHSIEMDEGLDYLLSVFPDGDITWSLDPAEALPIDSYRTVDSGRGEESLFANYKVSAGGKDYWLFLSEVRLDEIDNQDEVGLTKLGVTPWTEARNDGPGGKFRAWSHGSVGDPNIKNTSPGIYVPE